MAYQGEEKISSNRNNTFISFAYSNLPVYKEMRVGTRFIASASCGHGCGRDESRPYNWVWRNHWRDGCGRDESRPYAWQRGTKEECVASSLQTGNILYFKCRKEENDEQLFHRA